MSCYYKLKHKRDQRDVRRWFKSVKSVGGESFLVAGSGSGSGSSGSGSGGGSGIIYLYIIYIIYHSVIIQ